MSPAALSLFTLAAALGAASAQAVTGTFPPVPLASKHFTYPNLPFQVDTDQGLIRGTQTGYNICNSTTENQDSLCQTSFFNDATDFCLWAPSKPGETVADVEGEMVAWCSKPGHGTRLIPEGALTGLQFLKTPDYIQVVGFIDQTKINMASGDFGGEMDPHGADLRGNPMGGVMFSTSFGNGIQQVIEWTNFMGSNSFCLKACDPAGANAANFCQHIYDRIGCAYNAPNAAQDKVFEACQADNADFPGVYTGADGAVTTYKQPAESLGPITSIPFTAKVPKSSNCTPLTSSAVFTGLPTAAAAAVTGSGSASGSGSSSGSATVTGSATAKPTGTSGSGSSTGGANAAQSSQPSDATTLAVSTIAGLFGVMFSVVFLA
ncbi:hypothetical protein CPC08DRAFT_713723 [Agrocybe pediades]|nr:hypothetical protein CPC08DRAFT_713723 [Agrocybe pediades]